MDSFEVKKIIIAEIYAFRRKKCELRTGPGALAPPPTSPGPPFGPGPLTFVSAVRWEIRHCIYSRTSLTC